MKRVIKYDIYEKSYAEVESEDVAHCTVVIGNGILQTMRIEKIREIIRFKGDYLFNLFHISLHTREDITNYFERYGKYL